MKKLNQAEVDKFMQMRMRMGYSFRYIKGLVRVNATTLQRMNVTVKCVETGETFDFIWDTLD